MYYSLEGNPEDHWIAFILHSYHYVLICNITSNEHNIEHAFTYG